MKTTASNKNFATTFLLFTLAISPLYLIISRSGTSAEIPITLLLVSSLTAIGLKIYTKSGNLISISTMMFFALFFVIAPIIQLSNSSTYLVNTMPVNPTSAAFANLLTTLFLITFILFEKKLSSHPSLPPPPLQESKVHFLILTLASIACAGLGISEINNIPSNANSEINLSEQLIKSKVILLIPFVAFSIYTLSLKKITSTNLIILAILIACVLATKNHIIERRNAIGPVYLSMIALTFPFIISNGKRYFYFVLTTMLIAFPASSLLTHASNRYEAKISFELIIDSIKNHFLEPHYDAWANLVATIEIVEYHGHALGSQFLGSILFFIPRSIWDSKPAPTGLLIGDFLSANHTMWFNNLSAPIVAEGYIDLGIPGVIFMALAAAYFSSKLHKLSKRTQSAHVIFYIYSSFFIFFVLRGSLMSGIAYLSGAAISIYLTELISRKTKFKLGNIRIK